MLSRAKLLADKRVFCHCDSMKKCFLLCPVFHSFYSLCNQVKCLFVILCFLMLATVGRAATDGKPEGFQKRWFFVWRNMNEPKEVDRMIARFPEAKAAGYNGVAFSYNVPAAKARELKKAAADNGLDLGAIVMGSPHDRNYVEGVLAKDALYVAKAGAATLQADNPTKVLNGDFEGVKSNHFTSWTMQDDEGLTSFADHDIVHGGKCSLPMENIGKTQ